VDIPFNAALWANVRIVDDWLPAATDWGFTLGSGDLAPAGSSVLYLEHTAHPGRSFTGRVNTPYLPVTLLNEAGQLDISLRSALQTRYARYLLGAGNADNSFISPLGVSPAVYSKKLDQLTPITSSTVQPNPSRLRSRQR